MDLRMPGKDLKASYPPCNRAFALRMMNPMSYQEGHMSPLDQIQPVVKRSIAKGISDRKSSENNFDDTSLSPASSLASFNDMELYDIEENDHRNAMNGNLSMQRQNASLDSFTHTKGSPRPASVCGKPISNGFMTRSYSSTHGFDNNSDFTRGAPKRTSVPIRVRSRNTPKNSAMKVNGVTPPASKHSKSNGYRSEVSKHLNSNKSSSPEKSHLNGSPLRRTQSLRDKPRSVANISTNGAPSSTLKELKAREAPSESRSKTPNSKIRVGTTKSSQLRAHMHQNEPTKQHPRTNTNGVKSRKRSNANDSADLSGSDSSIVLSEMDAYNPRNNPRHKYTTNRNHVYRYSSDSNNTLSDDSSLNSSYDSALQFSIPSTPAAKPNLSSSPLLFRLPKSDTFSSKLAEVCNLITEEHPGDFQIIETLVEMQAAYEDRNEVVKKTIANLRNRVKELEHKVSNSPNIPSLVVPLMRATKIFENQMQSIMDSQHGMKSIMDKGAQAPEDNAKEDALEEISFEANAVAAEIEKLCVNTTENNVRSEHWGVEETSESLDSYAIIAEPATET